MRVSTRCALIALCATGLAACASSADKTAYVAPERVGSGPTVVTDDAYVDYVERVARRRGIDLQWVNMPTKRIAKE